MRAAGQQAVLTVRCGYPSILSDKEIPHVNLGVSRAVQGVGWRPAL